MKKSKGKNRLRMSCAPTEEGAGLRNVQTERGALPIAQQRIYALLPLVTSGFATFCLRYHYGKTSYIRGTLYPITNKFKKK